MASRSAEFGGSRVASCVVSPLVRSRLGSRSGCGASRTPAGSAGSGALGSGGSPSLSGMSASSRGTAALRHPLIAVSCYRAHLWRDTCHDLGVTPKRTRPYHPQTNDKIERFHRTLAAGWAFTKLCASESARRKAFASLAARVQPSQAPHRDRQGPTNHPLDQPPWALQLAPDRHFETASQHDPRM